MVKIRSFSPRVLVTSLTTLLLIVVGLFWYLHASGLQMSNRFLSLADPRPSTSTTYRLGFDVLTSGSVGSVRVQFCSNAPIIGTPCTPPSGFDISGATIQLQSGMGGFSKHASTTANVLVLTRPPFIVNPVQARFELTDVINPDTEGSYYARIETFASSDATGPHRDYGGLAFNINSGLTISTTVPPFLLFCSSTTITGTDCATASGSYVNFGELNRAVARSGTTQMVAATNGNGGYVISVNGNTMQSGTDSIPAIISNDVSRPGISQFGINLRNNSDPDVGLDPIGPGAGVAVANYNTPNRYRFVSGDTIVSAPAPDSYRKYTVSYIVNVARSQAPGIYVSTITYVCLATF